MYTKYSGTSEKPEEIREAMKNISKKKYEELTLEDGMAIMNALHSGKEARGAAMSAVDEYLREYKIRIMGEFGIKPADFCFEDCMQEMSLTVFQELEKWDPEKGGLAAFFSGSFKDACRKIKEIEKSGKPASARTETDWEKFRSILFAAMDGMTQKEFAAQCGISTSYFNKLLKKTGKESVSMVTLKKIADNSSANYHDLLAACGYIKNTEIRSYNANVRGSAVSAYKAFRDRVNAFVSSGRLFKNAEVFIDNCCILDGAEGVSFSIGHRQEYDGELVQYAEFFSNAFLEKKGSVKNGRVFFVLYFNETKGGRFIPVAVRSDGKALLESGIMNKEYAAWRYGSIEEAENVPYICNLTLSGKYASAEEKLLACIFGEDEENTPQMYETRTVGIGFPVAGISGFSDFVSAHADAVKEDSLLFIYCRENGIRLDDCCAEQVKEYRKDEEDGEDYDGMPAFIADIMAGDSGIRYQVTEDDNGKHYIVYTEDSPRKYDEEELLSVSREYAAELGVPEYGKYIVKSWGYVEGRMVYHTEEEDM